MVADDLADLLGALAEGRLEPAAVVVMHPQTLGLGDRRVRDLAEQRVLEAMDAPLARGALVGLDDEVAPGGLSQQVEARCGAGNGSERRRREEPADDRCSVKQPLHLRRHAIEPRRDESLQGRRDLDGADLAQRDPAAVPPLDATGLDERAQELFDVQRIALRTRDDIGTDLFGQGVDREQLADEKPGIVRAERRERDGDGVSGGRAERRPDLAEVRTREAHDEQWRARPFGEMLDELDERRLRPVQVLEHEHERRACAALEEAPHAPAQLLHEVFRGDVGQRLGRLGQAQNDLESPRDGCSFVRTDGTLDRGAQRLHGLRARRAEIDARVGTQDLLHRIERDALPVRQAAADADLSGADHSGELGREPRLSRPGRAEHGHERWRPLRANASERIPEDPQLAISADERRV